MKYLDLFKEMFAEMVEKKNADLTSTYYHPDFICYTNGIEMTYDDFHKGHVDIYKTPIQYRVRWQDDTLLEEGERIGGRFFITTQMPDEDPKEIEVVLVGSYKEGKLYRLWELTFPDWSKEDEFEVFSED